MDDEPAYTRLVKLNLSDYDVREVNDPMSVLAAAREFQPDLLLLDVIMPGTDGGELAAKIRADPSLSRMPVVFLTAIVSPQEALTRPTLGGFPFLAKPVTAETLKQCISMHLPRPMAPLTTLDGLSRRVVNGAKRLTGFFTGGAA